MPSVRLWKITKMDYKDAILVLFCIFGRYVGSIASGGSITWRATTLTTIPNRTVITKFMSRVAYSFRATAFILVNIRHATQPLQKRKDIIRSLTAVRHAAQLAIRANYPRHRITKPSPEEIGTNMQQFRQSQNRSIGIEPAAKNGGLDMFD